MKTLIALLLAALAVAPARAQILRPEAVTGAGVGALAGAIIGHNSGDLRHNGWKGAAIGAGAGLIIGSAVGANHEHRVWSRTQVPHPHHAYYGSPRWYYSGYTPSYYSSPYYYDSYNYSYADRPNYAVSGTVLGGVLGAIIGHNSGDLRHNGWKGAAIGAGAGLLLGSIAESNARQQEAANRAITQSYYTPVNTGSGNATAPQNVTIINNYYNSAPATAMTAANGLYGR